MIKRLWEILLSINIFNVFLSYFKEHYLQSDIYQDGAIEFGDEPQAEILTPTIELLPHQDKRNGS